MNRSLEYNKYYFFRRGKKKVTRMVVIVVLAFAICWCPIQVSQSIFKNNL